MNALSDIAPRLMPILMSHNLTFGMYACMWAVHNHPGTTKHQLHQLYGISIATLTKTMASLLSWKFIHVSAPPLKRKGRPQNQYALTQAGITKLLLIQHQLQQSK